MIFLYVAVNVIYLLVDVTKKVIGALRRYRSKQKPKVDENLTTFQFSV